MMQLVRSVFLCMLSQYQICFVNITCPRYKERNITTMTMHVCLLSRNIHKRGSKTPFALLAI